ncbi:MAG: hypothetical protein QNK23_18100 [Crocinitomicaceae bacterium]|nr:hypothetical protein [Crocinitomicaceae bacterium]
MRILIYLLFMLIQVQAFANMANPVLSGTLGGRPFVNQYVDVVHEDLFIKIDDKFEFAQFNVRYHINSSRDGIQIPFLFYASAYLDSFIVKIDGVEVKVKDIPYDFEVQEGAKFKDFSYFFENSDYNESVVLEESPKQGFYISLDDMIYFETDISEGSHIIEVSYRATKWTDTWDWINEYSFRYALSPAKYWKSFGTLTIEVNATNFNKPLTTNLGVPNSGSIDSIAIWKFDSIPVEVLQINFKPEVDQTADTMMKIGPSGLSYITGAILAVIHLLLLIWYRRRNPLKKYSIVVIVGSVLIPLIFLITWMNYYDFIDSIIGEHASRRHGYTFFVIALYPIILPIYWVIYWLIDKRVKNKNTQ